MAVKNSSDDEILSSFLYSNYSEGFLNTTTKMIVFFLFLMLTFKDSFSRGDK